MASGRPNQSTPEPKTESTTMTGAASKFSQHSNKKLHAAAGAVGKDDNLIVAIPKTDMPRFCGVDNGLQSRKDTRSQTPKTLDSGNSTKQGKVTKDTRSQTPKTLDSGDSTKQGKVTKDTPTLLFSNDSKTQSGLSVNDKIQKAIQPKVSTTRAQNTKWPTPPKNTEETQTTKQPPAPKHTDETQNTKRPPAAKHTDETQITKRPPAPKHTDETQNTKRPPATKHTDETQTTKRPTTSKHTDEIQTTKRPTTSKHTDETQNTKRPTTSKHTDGTQNTKRPTSSKHTDETQTTKRPTTSKHTDETQTTKRPPAAKHTDETQTTKRPTTPKHTDETQNAKRPTTSKHTDETQNTKRPTTPKHTDETQTTKRPTTSKHTDETQNTKRPTTSKHTDETQNTKLPTTSKHTDETQNTKRPTTPKHTDETQTTRDYSSPTKTSSKTPVAEKQAIADLEQEARNVMSRAGIIESPTPVQDSESFFDNEVKLNKKEKNKVWKSCKRLRDALIEALDAGTSWKWDYYNSGSSYDGTKVKKPDEVDCMFYPKNINTSWMSIEFDGAPPGYCFLKLKKLPDEKKDHYSELKNMCSDDLYVSSAKFREKVFDLMTKKLKHHRRTEVIANQKTGSPSLAVKYDAIPDAQGQGLRTIDMDLVPAIHLEYWPKEFNHNLGNVPEDIVHRIKVAGFDVIPKEVTATGFDEKKSFLWRLSFSRAEKQLTHFADRKEPSECPEEVDINRESTCRKRVLRTLKRILELVKGYDTSKTKVGCEPLKQLKNALQVLRTYPNRQIIIEKFSTFQIRTLLWAEFYVTYPGLHLWKMNSFVSRLRLMVIKLQKMLSGKMRVYHFFIPGLDIMEEVPKEEREFLFIMFKIAEALF